VPAVAADTVLFGWVQGTWISVLSALVAHSLWFWLARTSLRGIVQARAGDRVRWLIGVIDRGGTGLVIAWNVLGGPGVPFLFAAALSRLRYRVFALGVLCMLPRVLLMALAFDSLAQWDLSEIPPQRWLLLAGVGVPIALAYLALLALRPDLRPWRFGQDLAPGPDQPPASSKASRSS
ncbi:MAG: VTT domain-containing protein, partial [Oligoflexia bacterium]|nr:VTT domain-containing protein [Oligoflexia bacterium]